MQRLYMGDTDNYLYRVNAVVFEVFIRKLTKYYMLKTVECGLDHEADEICGLRTVLGTLGIRISAF